MKYFKIFVCSLGWICLAIVMISGYLYSGSNSNMANKFEAISWSAQTEVFQGVLSCALLPDELNERLGLIKEELFDANIDTEELDDGYIFYFNDENELADKVLDFVKIEKKCCPFFKFDVSILPFSRGIALKVSGGPRVKDFIDSYFKI